MVKFEGKGVLMVDCEQDICRVLLLKVLKLS